MAPKKENEQNICRKRRQPPKDTDEYMKKRERNNMAVKKSRDKARVKQKETSHLVAKLRQENAELDRKVKLLAKELDVLRDIFLSHAASMKEEEPINDANPTYVSIKHEQHVEVPKPVAIALMDHEYCS